MDMYDIDVTLWRHAPQPTACAMVKMAFYIINNLLISAWHNSLAVVLYCNGKSQQYSVKSSSSSASKSWIFTVSNSKQFTSFSAINQMAKPVMAMTTQWISHDLGVRKCYLASQGSLLKNLNTDVDMVWVDQ